MSQKTCPYGRVFNGYHRATDKIDTSRFSAQTRAFSSGVRRGLSIQSQYP